MRPEDIRELVRRQPFAAFRMHVSDGTVYEIRHPEMAWVRQSVVLIGSEAKQARSAPDHDYEIVSLLHVVRIEQLDGQPVAEP